MTANIRKTVNLDPDDLALLQPYLAGSSIELDDLEDAVGPLTSESSRIRALLLVGARHLDRERARSAYELAIANGDFTDSAESVKERSRARRRRRGE